jgi:hypothetical protein
MTLAFRKSSMKRLIAFLCAAALTAWAAASTFAQESGVPPTKPQSDYTFTVKVGEVWTDTGLDLNRGDRVHIQGAILGCEGPTSDEKEHLALPSAPGGVLLAKLQPEETPVSATPDADIAVVAPSRLYLGVNSGHCHGTIQARVHVDWHKAAERRP